MNRVISETRLVLRALAHSWGSSLFAIVLLGVGIGAATALFSTVDAVLWRPLPFPHPDRLVWIDAQRGERQGMRVEGAILKALRTRSTTIQEIAIRGPIRGTMRTSEGAIAVDGERVSANFLAVMGVPPMAGRGFRPDEEGPGAVPVMLVSSAFWRRRLGADPAAIGRTVQFDGIPYTVIGIMPPSFKTDFWALKNEYWTPYVSNAFVRELERSNGYELIGRLRPGASIDAARREAQRIAASTGLAEWRDGIRRIGVDRLRNAIVTDSANALLLMLAAVAVVLAMACANLAQMLLARSERRLAEFAIRGAIGAGPFHLFRLAVMEALMLSLLGGIGGAVLATWLVPLIISLAPSEIPKLSQATVDVRALAVAVGLAALTGCTIGLAPALRLCRVSVVDILRRAPRQTGSDQTGFRSSLLMFQVGTCVALTSLAGLVGQSFLALLPSDPGFTAESRLVFPLLLDNELFSTQQERQAKTMELLRRIRAVPGITEVGLSSNIPFSGDDDRHKLVEPIDDAALTEGRAGIRADIRAVSPNIFDVWQMPLLSGRAFTSGDQLSSPGVVIVNQTLARRLSSGSPVLGRKVTIEGSASLQTYEIVGVVADARSSGSSATVWNEAYIPFAQSATRMVYVIIESTVDEHVATSLIRSAVHSVMPDVPLSDSQVTLEMQDLIYDSLAQPRFSAVLIGAFSATAILLASMGLFGLVTYSVARRQQELGIRAALGARRWDLIMSSIRPVLKMTAFGILLGLIAGAHAARFLMTQLYGVTPLDIPTFAGAAGLMLVIAGVAAYFPALRAGRIDPLRLLRHE